MKPRPLANVLIKILGLSLCANGVSPVIQMFWQIYGTGVPSGMLSMLSGNLPGYFFASLAPVGIGVVFIVFSRSIAAMLFSDEE